VVMVVVVVVLYGYQLWQRRLILGCWRGRAARTKWDDSGIFWPVIVDGRNVSGRMLLLLSTWIKWGRECSGHFVSYKFRYKVWSNFVKFYSFYNFGSFDLIGMKYSQKAVCFCSSDIVFATILGVNFINILCTNFTYKNIFGRFFLLICN